MEYRLTFDNADSPSGDEALFKVNSNLFTGAEKFREQFGAPTSLEMDLLVLSAGVFAADRATPRGERERISRQIKVTVPVVNAGKLAGLKSPLERILRRLSSDSWDITFNQVSGDPEQSPPVGDTGGSTLLFSGGLDSLSGAVRLAETEQLDLVSHITRNSKTVRAQNELIRLLADRGIVFPHSQYFVSSRSDPAQNIDHAIETSQRSRSFVFLVLGALSARRSGNNNLLYLAENGQMAIHLPLTQGRIGAFSTHTAHPDVLSGMQDFLSSALSFQISISNPFVHETKAEVIRGLVANHPDLIWLSESCWKNSRLPGGASHCGECIPCFVRRIAVEHAGLTDKTSYHRDVWSEDVSRLTHEDVGRRNLIDLLEFVVKLEKLSNEDMLNEWPSLYSANINKAEVIDMYRRFSVEARTVLMQYANIVPLFQ